jgi:hypothetical protein
MWQISPVTVPDSSTKGAEQSENAHRLPESAKSLLIVASVGVFIVALRLFKPSGLAIA